MRPPVECGDVGVAYQHCPYVPYSSSVWCILIFRSVGQPLLTYMPVYLSNRMAANEAPSSAGSTQQIQMLKYSAGLKQRLYRGRLLETYGQYTS